MRKNPRRGRAPDAYSGEDIFEEPVVVDSRRHILDCAAKLFRTEGYAATSLRGIAEAAGMRAASLYHYFESKDQIVIEVLNRGVLSVFREVRRSVEALGEKATCEEVITAAITAHLRSLLELQDYTSANTRIFGQIPQHVRAATLKPRVQYEQFWTELLQRCIRQSALRSKPDLHLVRLFLFGSMNGTLEWYQPEGRHSVEGIARELTRIFLRGIGVRLRN